MVSSKSLYTLLIFVISVSSRSVDDNYTNDTKYDCLTDTSCDDYDNIKIFNHKVFCCKPNHTIIFKIEISNNAMDSSPFQTFEQSFEAERHQHILDKKKDSETKNKNENKISEDEGMVKYLVVNEEYPTENEHKKNRNPHPSENAHYTDEHFPTALYFDLKEDSNGKQKVRRDLRKVTSNDKPKSSKLLQRSAQTDSKKLVKANNVAQRRSMTTAMCVCDKAEPKSIMEFIQNFLHSLCTMDWF